METSQEKLSNRPAAQLNDVWIVDLDHTLVRTDTGVEGFLKFLKRRPLHLFSLIQVYLSRGLGPFKEVICRQTPVEASLLPYRWELIEQLKTAKAAGHRLILATASHQITADGVAKHLGIFDDVIATRTENLKGKAKTQAIREWIGDQAFLYWGDSEADFQVWSDAARIGVVNPSKETMERLLVSHAASQILVFRDPAVPFSSFLRAIRLHQWSKNLLVFLPIVGAHLVFDLDTLTDGLLAALSFSFVASAIYLINDILDAESDRTHDTKKNRPFARGDFSTEYGLKAAGVFLAVGFGICGLLPGGFLTVLTGYFLLTSLYSFWLKQVLLLDVMVLAGLYTLRIFAGGAAASIALSQWLLAFSMFFFFSLAFVKRYTELRNTSAPAGRGYRSEDRATVFTLGIGSGLLSVLVFSLYIASPEIAALYPKSDHLWLAVPLIFFWVSRIWFLAERGEVQEDPVVFALRDKVSYFVGLVFVMILVYSSGFFR